MLGAAVKGESKNFPVEGDYFCLDQLLAGRMGDAHRRYLVPAVARNGPGAANATCPIFEYLLQNRPGCADIPLAARAP